jgi:hypothetical protein
MNEESRKQEASPRGEVVQRIDFDEASSGLIGVNNFGEALLSLDVAGTKPYMNMRVALEPLTYVTRPEYWGIEVVGRLRGGIALPTVAPFSTSIEVGGRDGIMGIKGFEVIGATRSERLEPAPLDEDLPIWKCGAWVAMHNQQHSGSQVLYVVGRCVFPTAGYWVELRRHKPQGSNPKDLLLELVVHATDAPRELTVVEASYSEETDFQYDTVTILPDDVSVRVQEVL